MPAASLAHVPKYRWNAEASDHRTRGRLRPDGSLGKTYRHHLSSLAQRAPGDLETFQGLWKDMGVERWKVAHNFPVIDSSLAAIYGEFSPEKWERHSLLGLSDMEAIFRLRHSLTVFFYVIQEMERLYQDHLGTDLSLIKSNLKESRTWKR